jgi:hypothetical protein
MAIHSSFTKLVAVVGALSLAGASVARAQDTSAAARSDTSGYRGYQNQNDTAQAGQQGGRSDSAGMKYTGPATDTALKAKPGVQTGPSAGDSGKAAGQAGMAAMADTVVCKDGSNAANGKSACGKHGGIDWSATEAALKARGRMTGHGADSAAAPADTSQNRTGAEGYRQSGVSSDTALKAKPGTQTGRTDSSAAGKTDTSSSGQYKSP